MLGHGLPRLIGSRLGCLRHTGILVGGGGGGSYEDHDFVFVGFKVRVVGVGDGGEVCHVGGETVVMEDLFH